ncbi:MAG: hypothetical protein LBQ97_00015 [Fusobacteriaceae bacterium]|nr:hypothetical protein [Fusobacteriaceae bacterium]
MKNSAPDDPSRYVELIVDVGAEDDECHCIGGSLCNSPISKMLEKTDKKK